MLVKNNGIKIYTYICMQEVNTYILTYATYVYVCI